jgi:HEAT repeat protein
MGPSVERVIRLSLASTLALALLVASVQEDAMKRARELVTLLATSDPAAREEAVQGLKILGESARAALEGAAKDLDSEVSSRAKFLLARLEAAKKLPEGLRRTRPALLDRLAAGLPGTWGKIFVELAGQPSVRRRDLDRIAPFALGEARAEELDKVFRAAVNRNCRAAIPFIVESVASQDKDVQNAAVNALKEFGAFEAEKDLAALLGNPRPGTRRAAAAALDGIFGPDAAPLLLPLLRDPDEQTVRDILLKLEGQSTAKVSPEAIQPLLLHSSADIRCTAIRFLSGRKFATAPLCFKELLRDPDANVRQAVVKALGSGEFMESVPLLRELLSDREPEVCGEAIRWLSTLGDRDSIPKMLAILKDEKQALRVRAAAAEALRPHKIKEAGNEGLILLRHADRELRSVAALLVGESLGPPAAKELAPLLADPDADIRRTVASIVGGWKSGEVAAAVAPILEHHDPEIRESVLILLGKLGGTGIAGQIGAKLDDPAPGVRNIAAQELVMIESPDVAP